MNELVPVVGAFAGTIAAFIFKDIYTRAVERRAAVLHDRELVRVAAHHLGSLRTVYGTTPDELRQMRPREELVQKLCSSTLRAIPEHLLASKYVGGELIAELGDAIRNLDVLSAMVDTLNQHSATVESEDSFRVSVEQTAEHCALVLSECKEIEERCVGEIDRLKKEARSRLQRCAAWLKNKA